MVKWHHDEHDGDNTRPTMFSKSYMLDISNTTKKSPGSSQTFFCDIKNKLLGKKYELSLNFIGNTRARRINTETRGKTYAANILSFPLDDDSGEMFINLNQVPVQAPKYDLSQKDFIIFLFIHGCLHLKGFEHGEEMDELEEKYLKKFTK